MQNLCRTVAEVKWRVFMSRISDETKADTAYYAAKKYIPHIGDICNSRDEVDAAVHCMWIIKKKISEYDHAVGVAPKYPARTAKTINELLLKAQNQYQHSDILQEWKAVSPWYSDVKSIKNEILDECRDILKDADIGTKRIDKIIPLLTWHLQYDDELLPQENQKLLDLIKSF